MMLQQRKERKEKKESRTIDYEEKEEEKNSVKGALILKRKAPVVKTAQVRSLERPNETSDKKE